MPHRSDRPTDSSSPLRGCYVISLRPVGGHGALRRAAGSRGARLLALSPWRIGFRDDPATRDALRAALAAAHVVFTSPAAVRAAAALQPLQASPGQAWLAVGGSTARALRGQGIRNAASPARMDSEGLLGMPQLEAVRGREVGLVTAPGGRGAITDGLRDRGAEVRRADIYARIPVRPSPRVVARLRRLGAPAWLMLSSGEALARILSVLPADAAGVLRAARVVAASDRLRQFASEQGFTRIVRAEDATPAAMVAAAMRHAKAPGDA